VLARGRLADFVVLDRDVTRVEPGAIRETRVLVTVVGGRVVHEAETLDT
jgi:predicted amidohydrolase YtcJ